MKDKKLDNATWDIYDLLQDYQEDTSIWNEEEDKIRITKHIINNHLTEAEKRVLLIYVDAGSIRAAAEILHVSQTTYRMYLNNVKKKIIEQYDREIDMDDTYSGTDI